MTASYNDYVAGMSLRNPSLGALCSFLGQTPREVHNSSISYALVERDGQIGLFQKATASDLISQVNSRLTSSMLVVVENIHQEDIESLGSALGINPFFFCGHIASSYRDVEVSALPPLLALPPSQIVSRQFLNIHYQKVIDLGGECDLGDAPCQLTLLSNVPRGVRRLPSLSGRSVGLLRGCTSVLKHDLPGDLWICLILVDPAADIVAHSAHDISGSHNSRISQIPRRIVSESSQDLPSYAEFQSSAQSNSDHRYLTPSQQLLELFSIPPPGWENGKPSILSLAYHPIQTINREWMLYASLMSRYIKYYEYSFSTVSSRVQHFEKNDIVDLHRWRRRSQQTLYMLQMVRLFVKYWREKAIFSSPELSYTTDPEVSQANLSAWDLLLMDFNQLEDQIQQHAQSLEALNPIITSLVQLIDSHKSIAQAEDVRRLTFIAIAFVPLSYIAGIFSMGDSYSPGGKHFWVYWVTAVPIAALIMGFLTLENRMPLIFELREKVSKILKNPRA